MVNMEKKSFAQIDKNHFKKNEEIPEKFQY